MKRLLLVCLFLWGVQLFAQTSREKLYDPSANAENELASAVKEAKSGQKNVLVVAGGNWCVWCIEFNRFCKADAQIDSMIKADYIVCHLNYSPENKNTALFARYGYPQRFGFPVFLILDGNGNRIHTQNSAYLEQGKSYNKKKVEEFFQQWNSKAINPG